MTTLIKTLGLALTLAAAPCAYESTACAEAAATTTAPAAAKPDLKKVESHLKEHQKYPATRAELLAECQGLSDFTAGEKAWFGDHLAEGTYKSAGDVMKALRRK